MSFFFGGREPAVRSTRYRHVYMQHALWIGNAGFRIWNSAPEVLWLEVQIWNLEFGIRNLESEVWILEFEVWNLEFGVWSLEFEI